MDKIDAAITEAYEMAAEKRQRGGHLLSGVVFEGADLELDGWRKSYEEKILHYLSLWRPDKETTEQRIRKNWKGNESLVDVGDVFDIWQNMAQEELLEFLTAEGLPAETSQKIAKTYTVQAFNDGGR